MTELNCIQTKCRFWRGSSGKHFERIWRFYISRYTNVLFIIIIIIINVLIDYAVLDSIYKETRRRQ